ncbi:GNAT family N-acetyltransferase [Alteromonadaceae bacterium BrNp21-10]|nr:GNAT family N-acetyltransferase [Alteromonadaceae bacterium BrNp21-10]
MNIKLAKDDQQRTACFDLIHELRPHLTLESFLNTVHRMEVEHQYNLAYLSDNGVKAVAGFRMGEWLHRGRYLEIEELITCDKQRSKGYGGKLFDWLNQYAAEHDCRQVRLVSGVSREDAHRFYLKKGMTFEAKYFSMNTRNKQID